MVLSETLKYSRYWSQRSSFKDFLASKSQMFRGPKFTSNAPIIKQFVRTKKKSALTPSTQKVVNQLSALSASRKQPKLISLCNEDLIKHRTIDNAWKLYKRKKQQRQDEDLKKQYESIVNAMNDLKETSPELFEHANKPESDKRFSLEMRIPTEYPSNKPWFYDYVAEK